MEWKTHHDARAYDEANSAAAQYMRQRMEEEFQRGRESAAKVIDTVLHKVPDDALVRGRSLTFDTNGRLRMLAGDTEWHLHSHALGQIAGRVDIPAQYVRKLEESQEPWRRNLLAHTLNEMYRNGEDRRFLVRSLDGEARGFLSDSYRRLDSRPLLDAFCGAVRDVGAVLLKGTASDVRVALKVALPMVFEPVKDEIMGFGLEWSNSDYGNGKHAVSVFLWRIWCTNLATCENSLAQVHLGRKLPDNLALSEETYRLDTETTVSALKDIVGQCLGPPKIKALCAAVKEAHEAEVDWSAASRKLASVLTKAEQKAVQDAFEGRDVQTLPPGKTKWRLSNAVSMLAGNTESPDRTLELERLAGQIIDTHVKEAA